MIREEIYEKYIDEQVMESISKEKYCSSEHGDPYPPCYNPSHKCKDCYLNQLKSGYWIGGEKIQ